MMNQKYLKEAVSWIAMGAAVVIWVSTNFASSSRLDAHEKNLDTVAKIRDVEEIRTDIRELRSEIIEIIKDKK